MTKPAHHAGTYRVRADATRTKANNNPATTCWRCGRTLAQHPPTKTGKPPQWTAGHIRDSDPTSPLKPEATTCNYSAGGVLGNQRQKLRKLNTTRQW